MQKFPLSIKEFIGTLIFAFSVFSTKSPYVFAVVLMVMSVLLPGATFNPAITLSSAYATNGSMTKAMTCVMAQVLGGITAFMVHKHAF
jgi:glycerol uptake facilitator-like aquaporin